MVKGGLRGLPIKQIKQKINQFFNKELTSLNKGVDKEELKKFLNDEDVIKTIDTNNGNFGGDKQKPLYKNILLEYGGDAYKGIYGRVQTEVERLERLKQEQEQEKEKEKLKGKKKIKLVGTPISTSPVPKPEMPGTPPLEPSPKPEMPGTPPLEPIPEEEKEEAKEEEAKPQEPPTMSPDERDVMEEEIKQEQLSEQKKDMPTTKRQPRTNIATFKSKMESIPESRLGTQGKEVNELVDDIEFFLKEFPSQLKSEKTIFNKVDKNNKNDLIKLHTKIATKLKPNISSSSSSSNKKVGIVINAESYIKEQMKKLLEEGVFSNLKPADIVVDAAGTKKDNNEGTKDIGNFEVKETPDGGLSAKREGIYRYLPSENEQPNEGKKKKNNQLKIPKPQERNRATNAISMNKQNPFKRPQKTLKLKYLY
jgi:hypothetical protein